MSRELEGWKRYVAVIGGIVITGGICALAARFLVAPRGAIGPAVLQAQSVLAASIATIVCFGLSTVIAGVVGRFVNAVVGLFVLGAGLWILRLRVGTIEDLAFANGSIGLVALETALWSVLILGAAIAVFRISGPLPDIAEPDAGEPWHRALGLRGLGASLLMIPAVWLVARSPLPLQTMAAAALGGMAAGMAGRLLAPHAQPILLFAAPCFVGAAGHLIGAAMLREPLPDAFVTRTLAALSLPMPLDYAAGSLVGVSIGLGWAKGFLQHEATEPAGFSAP